MIGRGSGHEGDILLRVHFTVDDLLQVTFADEPAPLMEPGLALATLQRTEGDPHLGAWRSQVRRALPDSIRPLLEIVPPAANGPLFLDPPTPDLEAGIDQVMRTPRTVVESELNKVFHSSPRPSRWVRELRARDGDAWRILRRSLLIGHRSMLAHNWEAVRNAFQVERAWRVHLLARSGITGLLGEWSEDVRWRGTTLELEHPRDLDIHPTGQGIRLLPSASWTQRPLVAPQPDSPTILIYPALASLPLLINSSPDDPLVALLGFTRARVLTVLTKPLRTRDVAAEVGVSASSASEHASVLRRAGLIATHRDGKAVWHCCTPRGLDLLTSRWTGDSRRNG
jgi:DNA-binding transcriptional ArsR family regulator